LLGLPILLFRGYLVVGSRLDGRADLAPREKGLGQAQVAAVAVVVGRHAEDFHCLVPDPGRPGLRFELRQGRCPLLEIAAFGHVFPLAGDEYFPTVGQGLFEAVIQCDHVLGGSGNGSCQD